MKSALLLISLFLLAQLARTQSLPGASPAMGVTVAGGNPEPIYKLNGPHGIFVDAAQNVYVTDRYNYRIQKWAPGASYGTTVAGGNGRGTALNQLYDPFDVYVNASGDIYVVDGGLARVVEFAAGTGTGTIVAGGNGRGTAANQFIDPTSIWLDAGGNLYVSEQINDRVQKWAPGGTTGLTVAGGQGAGPAPNQLYVPWGVFVDAAGNVYVADANNQRVQKWAQGATAGVTVAGGNGAGSAANQLNNPTDVFVDPSGSIYVVDRDNHRVQKWAPGATAGVTVAGGNGPGSAANQLNNPWSVFVDPVGNLYVSDLNNNRVQKFATTAAVSGLLYRYYEGDWNALPDFTTLTPLKGGLSSNVDISQRPAGREDGFAFVWEGYINIPVPGTYTFSTVSDDGSRLYFNTKYLAFATPLVNNDGLHGFVQVSGTVNINAAGAYPITITYFNKTGGKGISVYWSGPGFSQQPIPGNAFTQAASDSVAPGVPMNLHAVSVGKNAVSLDWDDATDNLGVSGYEILINGVSRPFFRITTAASAINLTHVDQYNRLVPNTTYTFTIVAYDQAGNRSAASAPLTVKTLLSSTATGITVAGGNDAGPAANQLNAPNDLFVDAGGNLYIADQGNYRIVKWAPGATSGVTVAGGNGPGTAPNQLSGPKDVFVDAGGNLYIADVTRVVKWAPGAASGVVVVYLLTPFT